MCQTSPRAPQALAEHIPAEGTPDTGFLSPDSSCQDPLTQHRVGAALQSSRPLFPQLEQITISLSLSLQFCKMGMAERGLRHLASMGGMQSTCAPYPFPTEATQDQARAASTGSCTSC